MLDLKIWKILIYIYVVFTESLGSHWITSVMPRIVEKNFKIEEKTSKSAMGANFFTYFFMGLIAGSVLWPTIVRFISKKNCLMISLLGQAFTNYFVGSAESRFMLLFWRFCFGFFHTMNTIGKDYIYEFADVDHRQYIFTLRSSSVMIASFFGPMIGYQIYYGYDQSFKIALAVISLSILFAALLFFIAFYILPDHVIESAADLEEVEPLHALAHKEISEHIESSQIPLIPMLKYIWTHTELRRQVAGFAIVFSVYNAENFLTIFYVETDWKDQGLGLSDYTVSLLVLTVFIPILILFLISPILIPKYISRFSFFRFIIIVDMLLLILVPGLRDIFRHFSWKDSARFIYFVMCLKLTFNLNLISPFLNYEMNNQIPKNSRTSFNSITFICCSLCVLFMFSTVIPLLSVTMFDPHFTQFIPFNKYVCFALLDIILLTGVFLLRHPVVK